MVLPEIFGFLTGVSFIVLLAHINRSRKAGSGLLNPDVIISAFLTLVLLLLAFQLYLPALVLFAAGCLFGWYFIKKRQDGMKESAGIAPLPEPTEIKEAGAEERHEEKKAENVKKTAGRKKGAGKRKKGG